MLTLFRRISALLLLSTVSASAAARTAEADECSYTWGDSMVCFSQYNDCKAMGPYTQEECAAAFHICNELVCLTLYPDCGEYCSSLPVAPLG
jgi:hypothetical protein